MECTLVLLKPDCVERHLIGVIINRFEQKSLKLLGMKFMQPLPHFAEMHYAEHKGKPFYPSLVEFLSSGALVAMVWQGKNSIEICRALVGATVGPLAGTIRGDFATSVQQNIVHASDSPASAEREINLWFQFGELRE